MPYYSLIYRHDASRVQTIQTQFLYNTEKNNVSFGNADSPIKLIVMSLYYYGYEQGIEKQNSSQHTK